jgi:hypothetical protein
MSGATTSTSPRRHCSTATWIIQLSPGGTLTVSAVPAIREPAWIGPQPRVEQPGPSLRLVHGGHPEPG